MKIKIHSFIQTLLKNKKDNDYHDTILDNIFLQNSKRLIILFYIAIPIILIHILLFYTNLKNSSPVENIWRLNIISAHTSILLLFLIIRVLIILYQKNYLSQKFINVSFRIFYLLLIVIAIWIVTADQLVTSAITPFLVICIVMSAFFLIRPLLAMLFFTIGYFLFFVSLAFTQANSDILLSNRVNGFTAVGIGVFLSVLLWRNTYERMLQALIIESQKKDLETQNRELIEQSEILHKTIYIKDKLFSIIGHDLRSPFTGILGYSKLLVKKVDSLDPETIKDFAENIHSVSTQAMGLLENLLDWSYTEQKNISFKPNIFFLRPISEQVIEQISEAAREKKITVHNKIPANQNLYADERIFSTILRNLLSNAIKFSYQDGTITIDSSDLSAVTLVTISDTGMGITPENLEKIFDSEIFFSTFGTSKEKGTGLGFRICREFMKVHNGNLEIETEPEKGTNIILTFPKNKEWKTAESVSK